MGLPLLEHAFTAVATGVSGNVVTEAYRSLREDEERQSHRSLWPCAHSMHHGHFVFHRRVLNLLVELRFSVGDRFRKCRTHRTARTPVGRAARIGMRNDRAWYVAGDTLQQQP
jgi:hypothetical protein